MLCFPLRYHLSLPRFVSQAGHLPLINCYAGQLNQVFMNILANAIDVLEENMIYDNHLALEIIESKPEQIGNIPTIEIHTEQLNPERVLIKIADNGSGMPETIRFRVFDPFFTTKSVGQGTGLGLSISYQIVVDKHEGSLEYYSKPGVGTEFRIEIPISQSHHSNQIAQLTKKVIQKV